MSKIEGASESMLVMVEVTVIEMRSAKAGKSNSLPRYRIEDVSGRAKPAFLRKAMRINLRTDNKFFAGFGLYQPVVIR